METEQTLERYLKALLQGDRKACRRVIEETMQAGIPAVNIYMDVIWPMMLEVDKLYRADKINSAQEHLATRINRTIIDQLQNKLPHKADKTNRAIICTASSQIAELGGQMTADLFESDGWEVRFLGGGVSNDDLLEFIGQYGPDLLVIYGAEPQQAPDIRRLIDTIRDVDSHPNMKIMLSGGLFARAEGLWEEIGADLFAVEAANAVQLANDPDQTQCKPARTINRRKRTQKNAARQQAQETATVSVEAAEEISI